MEELIYRDRRHTNSAKWDLAMRDLGTEDLISMSTADMDFCSPKCVIKSLADYVDFGVFGYYATPASYTEAFINFEKERHGNIIQADWVRYSPGCIPALNWLMQLYTKPGDAVMIQTPVYPPFIHAPASSGRKLICSPLKREGTHFYVDYTQFERDIVDNDVKVFVICSPHNPVGRVWTEEELETMYSICEKHNVFVISDEIHHNLIMDGYTHLSAVMLKKYSHMTAALMAPSKTFNLPALQNAITVIPDATIREKFDKFAEAIHVTGGNGLGYIAAESAYAGGSSWLDSVLKQVRENYEYTCARLSAELPKAVAADLQGTYLMWIDLSEYVGNSNAAGLISKKASVCTVPGSEFGGSDYANCIRLNIATSRETLEKGLDRIINALNNI